MGVFGTKAEVCNIALAKLGQRGTIENIDTPEKDVEKVFAKWYDVVRQLALQEQKPNFAIERRTVAENSSITVSPTDAFAFEYPSDCLAVLGIGEQQDKANDYWIEGYSGGKVIYTKYDYTTDGMPIRFIKDVTDVSKFTSEFVLTFASMLADKVCYEVTEDDTKKKIIGVDMKLEKASSASLNAQENRPIKINNSKYKQARKVSFPTNFDKG